MIKEFKKNEIHRVEVTDMNNLGAGVGHLGETVVFVQGGCTGDVADVKLIKVASRYLIGRIERLVAPSPHRIEPDCPVARRCGGCAFRHVSYAHELEFKRSMVRALFKKEGIDANVLPVLTANDAGEPIVDGYRNKAQYPVGRSSDGRTVVGFYANRTHEIIPQSEGCRLQPEIFTRICGTFRDFLDENRIEPYDEQTRGGEVRHIYLRRSESSGEVMVCVVVTRRVSWLETLAERLMCELPEVASVYENINSEVTNVVLGREYRLVAGRERLVDVLCGREFEISPASFWQVNRRAAELLYETAGRLADIKPGERVVDLFCGIGTIGMSISPRDARLTGIEIVESAVENARANAIRNGFDAEYVCIDAGDASSVAKSLGEPDVVILDPPRSGCTCELLELLASRTDARIVYISCGPDTLARDCARLRGLGYTVGDVQPVDLFPRTGHVETVCLLSKLHADQHIEVELNLDEMDLTTAESKATYDEIKEYVFENTGLKVSQLYIAQVKRKYGIIERANYNLPKSENAKVPNCPPDKEAAIVEAFKHFGMIK